MTKKIVLVSVFILGGLLSAVAESQNPMVGGAAMYKDKTIVQNAMNSADHTTLVSAVKTAGLVDTLNGPGPFTVFAPTNEAFNNLPSGTVESLMKPEHRELLKKILTYHVVAGRFTAEDLMKKIKQGGGTAELTTVEGGKLWAISTNNSGIELKDEKGNTAHVTIPNVFQSNGIIHVIDTVLMPK